MQGGGLEKAPEPPEDAEEEEKQVHEEDEGQKAEITEQEEEEAQEEEEEEEEDEEKGQEAVGRVDWQDHPQQAKAEDPLEQGMDERPALRSTILALTRQLARLHSNSDVALRAPRGRVYKCRRNVVATWSPQFQSLMETVEAADAAGPEQTQLPVIEVDAAPEMLEMAVRFMMEGRVTFDVRPLHDAHEILTFADTWGLEDLKATYGELMMAREPVCSRNAAPYLELGLNFSIRNISAVAADVLASSISMRTGLEERILSLNAACMQAVLASDELHVEDESQSLQIIERWAAVDRSARSQDVPDLLEHVRLSLCSFQTLIDLVSSLSSDPWQEVEAKRLNVKIRQTVDQKLDGVTSDTLRRSTKLPNSEQEQKLAATLHASRSLYQT